MAASSVDVLDSAHRSWLKSMGAALDAPLSESKTKTQAGGVPADSTAIGGQSPKSDPPVATPATPPVPDISVAGKPIVKQGSKGQDVKDLQTLLNKHGAILKVDSDFGALTTTAVKDFQTKHPPLKVDGVVGTQTWTALAANAPEPPKPPDTKPRSAIFIVTDSSTNDAVNDASIKIAEQIEKTGNTGQAVFSLPPGNHPFGVTADGFEQAIGTFAVTDKEESTQRVEMKAVERRAQVVLSVSPKGTSKKGDKLSLVANVTVGGGKSPPPGRLEFSASVNQSSRQSLATEQLQNGEAKLTITKLPKGTHTLAATYTPTPPIDGIVQATSAPVTHEITQDESDEDKDVAKRLIERMDEKDSEAVSIEVENSLQFRQMKRLLNVTAALHKAGRSQDLLDGLSGEKPENERVAVAILTMQRNFTRMWFNLYKKLNERDRKAVLARTPPKVIKAFELENDPVDPSDPNAEPDDPNGKIVIEPAVSAAAKLKFESKQFGNFGTTEFQVSIGPSGKLQGVDVDMTLVKEELKKKSGLGPVLDLEGKLSLTGGAEFGDDEAKLVVKEVQAAVKAEVQLKFPEIKVLKNVAFTLDFKINQGGEFHFGGAIEISIPGT